MSRYHSESWRRRRSQLFDDDIAGFRGGGPFVSPKHALSAEVALPDLKRFSQLNEIDKVSVINYSGHIGSGGPRIVVSNVSGAVVLQRI